MRSREAMALVRVCREPVDRVRPGRLPERARRGAPCSHREQGCGWQDRAAPGAEPGCRGDRSDGGAAAVFGRHATQAQDQAPEEGSCGGVSSTDRARLQIKTQIRHAKTRRRGDSVAKTKTGEILMGTGFVPSWRRIGDAPAARILRLGTRLLLMPAIPALA